MLALADPDDRDGDGISGRARMVEEDGARVLGRYGWKAAMPDLELQIADAFASDLGLSSPRRPLPHGDCTDARARLPRRAERRERAVSAATSFPPR